MAWQGGGLEIAEMEATGRTGEFRSSHPVPVSRLYDGERTFWKTLLRLHRGTEMMAVPIYLPADPEIGEGELSAIDQTARFESERIFLLRETTPGNGWLSPAVHLTLVGALAGWAIAFVAAIRHINERGPTPPSPVRPRRPAVVPAQ